MHNFLLYKNANQPREIWLDLVLNEKFCKDLNHVTMTLELIMERIQENILTLRVELPKLGYIFEQERDQKVLFDKSTMELFNVDGLCLSKPTKENEPKPINYLIATIEYYH